MPTFCSSTREPIHYPCSLVNSTHGVLDHVHCESASPGVKSTGLEAIKPGFKFWLTRVIGFCKELVYWAFELSSFIRQTVLGVHFPLSITNRALILYTVVKVTILKISTLHGLSQGYKQPWILLDQWSFLGGTSEKAL